MAGTEEIASSVYLDDSAIGENDDAAGHPGSHAEVVGNEDDGEPGIPADPGDRAGTTGGRTPTSYYAK